MKKYKLIGTIIEIKGKCIAGHKVGEKIDLTLIGEHGVKRGLNLCPFFLDVLLPYLYTMQFGGEFPWEEKPNIFTMVCPDLKNAVKIKIERMEINYKDDSKRVFQ